MRGIVWLVALLGLAAAGGAQPPAAAPDYAQAAAWLCRPGTDDGTCSAGLDAAAIAADGTTRPAPYRPAAAPAIDCFYVYPTASRDPGDYSDLTPGPEERRAVNQQAARLGSVCRLFAPLYRQLTGPGLSRQLHGSAATLDLRVPYADVLAAWRHYLAHDNGGRGVILIGHSQGAMLLKRLLAEEVDGKPAGRRLVAAYLAGNPDLTAASFHAIPPCAAGGQVGCVVAWSTYPAAATAGHFFGRGRDALCVNPAAPAGGRGMLKAFLPKPALAPADAPPNVEAVGQLSAECVRDADGAVLAVKVEPGRYAPLLGGLVETTAANGPPGWGLHRLDVNLVEGNLLELAAAQAAAWTRARR